MEQPSSKTKYVTTPTPREIAGYSEAVANRITPQVPSKVPTLDVIPTATQRMNLTIMVSLVWIAGVFAVLVLGQDNGALPWLSVAVLCVVAILGAVSLRSLLNKWGQAIVSEIQNGYITTPFKLGRFWIGRAPDGPISNGWIQWDWTATWVLNSKGEVLSAPSSGTEPPGLYPSPRRDNQLELWTGYQWTGHFPADLRKQDRKIVVTAEDKQGETQ